MTIGLDVLKVDKEFTVTQAFVRESVYGKYGQSPFNFVMTIRVTVTSMTNSIQNALPIKYGRVQNINITQRAVMGELALNSLKINAIHITPATRRF
ncbi:hypothetical protein BH11PLA2_BH11PLA2_05660 [soil metagenome]